MPDELSDDIGSVDDDSAGSSSDRQQLNTDGSAGDKGDDADGADGADGRSARSAAGDDGSIPLARHKQVVDDLRREFEDRYGWLDGLDRRQVERAILMSELMEDNIRNRGRSSNAEPPGPDLQTEDGRPLFSAEAARKLVDHHLAQLRAEFDERFSELESGVSSTRTERNIDAQLQAAQSWPYFSEHVAEITRELLKHQRAGSPISLREAYLNTIHPKLEQLARQKVIKEMKGKKPSDDIRPGSRQEQRRADADKPWGQLFDEVAAEMSK